MNPVIAAEFASAIYIGIALFGQYNDRSQSESSKWLRISAIITFFYLIIDGLSELNGVEYPFVLLYVINFLSYAMGSVVLIFFNKYCESYIHEITGKKLRIFVVPIILNVIFMVATTVLYVAGELVIYENGVEVTYYDYPTWLRVIQILAMLFTSGIAVSRWKSIGLKAVILLGLFLLAPMIAALLSIFDVVDMSLLIGAVTLVLIITILQNEHMKKQQEQLVETQTIATTDALTNVKNDLAYADKRAELNSAIKEKSEIEFAIVFCDINGLKTVNDTYGHGIGNVYIKNGCNILCDVYKKSPVYRIGGDEFIVVLQGEDFNSRKEKFEILHDRIREAENIEKFEEGKASFAAGMSEYDPLTDTDVSNVQGRADASMYREKGNRKRGISIEK